MALALLCLSSCYYNKKRNRVPDAQYSQRMRRLVGFSGTHHYSVNYNFIVKADSLMLLKQQPEELLGHLKTDSVALHRHDHIVVADIRIIPSSKGDSVWVQVARDQATFGWVQESHLLPRVVPADPISQFISVFSDMHLLISLIVISVIGFAYIMFYIYKKNAKIVHFNDIDSFFPTLLTINVACSATFYASIQLFAPAVWRHYYFHPTLNPLSVPPLLSVFLISVWSMLVVALAALDDVRRQLPFGDALLYLCGLAGVCAINYIVFSISTLYYIGYVFLAAYVFFALYRYLFYSRCRFVCGQCGEKLHHKGRCPYCGAINE